MSQASYHLKLRSLRIRVSLLLSTLRRRVGDEDPSTELMRLSYAANGPETIRSSLAQVSEHLRELLLQLLRNRKRCIKFRRQHAIGIYVAAFFCAEENPSSRSMAAITSLSKGNFMMKPVIVLCTRKAYAYGALTGKQVETEPEWVLAQIDQTFVPPSQAPLPPGSFSPRTERRGAAFSINYHCLYLVISQSYLNRNPIASKSTTS